MAGHSQFKNIMHRKGAQDKKRAKIFNKLGREITVAAKLGKPDPDANPRLRNAIQAARAANMPKDRIKRAVDSGAGIGTDQAVYEEIRYEGYGPGGAAVIVEALTDNRNRAASEVRTAFSKNGGQLGETNTVSFMFDRLGHITYPLTAGDADAVFEAAVEAGALNVESTEESHDIYTAPDDFMAVKDAVEKTLGEAAQAALIWKPKNTTSLDQAQAEVMFKLIETLEDSDDVQHVFSNFEIDDDIMEQLATA